MGSSGSLLYRIVSGERKAPAVLFGFDEVVAQRECPQFLVFGHGILIPNATAGAGPPQSPTPSCDKSYLHPTHFFPEFYIRRDSDWRRSDRMESRRHHA